MDLTVVGSNPTRRVSGGSSMVEQQGVSSSIAGVFFERIESDT
jgi:hypothetical protein